MDEKSRGVLKVLGVIGFFVGLISGGIEIFNFFFTPIDAGTAILAIAPCAGVVVIVVLGMILYAERSRPRPPDTSRRVSQVAEPKDTEAKRDRVLRETSRLPGKARWLIAIVLAFLYNVITLLIFFLMSDSTTVVTLDVCVWPVILYAILSYMGLWLGGMAPN